MGHVWQADSRLINRIISQEMEGKKPCLTMMELRQLREVDLDISKNREKLEDLQ